MENVGSTTENNYKYCFNCGDEISEVKFCPECGANQNLSQETPQLQPDSSTQLRFEDTTSQKTKPKPSITLFGYKINLSWGYTSMYISFFIILFGAFSDPLLLIIGYIALGMSVYADVNYVRQMSDWDPSAKKYVAGIILLFIVFFPLYIMRRKRAMRNVVPIN